MRLNSLVPTSWKWRMEQIKINVDRSVSDEPDSHRKIWFELGRNICGSWYGRTNAINQLDGIDYQFCQTRPVITPGIMVGVGSRSLGLNIYYGVILHASSPCDRSKTNWGGDFCPTNLTRNHFYPVGLPMEMGKAHIHIYVSHFISQTCMSMNFSFRLPIYKITTNENKHLGILGYGWHSRLCNVLIHKIAICIQVTWPTPTNQQMLLFCFDMDATA